MTRTTLGQKIFSFVALLAFALILVGCQMPDSSSAKTDAEALIEQVLGRYTFSETEISASFELNASYLDGEVEYSWSSNDEEHLKIKEIRDENNVLTGYKAVVIRPLYGEESAKVVLTLTAKNYYSSRGYVEDTKTFEFTILPNPAEISDISEILQLSAGDGAVARGVLVDYFRYSNTQSGFFIYDGTGYLFCYADNADAKIGDYVQVSGLLSLYAGVLQLQNDFAISVLDADLKPANLEVPEATTLNWEQIKELDTVAEGVSGTKYIIEGLLEYKIHSMTTNVNNNYYVTNPLNPSEFVAFYYKSMLQTGSKLEQFVGKGVKLEVILYNVDSSYGYPFKWVYAYCEGDVEEIDISLTDAQIINGDKITIEAMGGDVMPEAVVDLPAAGSLGSTITWAVKEGYAELASIAEGQVTFAKATSNLEVVLVATVSKGEETPVEVEVTYTITGKIDYLGIPEALEAAVDSYVYIKGYIKSIANTTYGNVYLEDLAGNEIYIYGIRAEAGGNNQVFASMGLEVGDCVGLYGQRSVYGETQQVKNTHLVEEFPNEKVLSAADAAIALAAEIEAYNAETDETAKAELAKGTSMYIKGVVATIALDTSVTEGTIYEKYNKYGNMTLVNGEGTLSLYGSFGKDANNAYIFRGEAAKWELVEGLEIVVRVTSAPKYGNYSVYEIIATYPVTNEDKMNSAKSEIAALSKEVAPEELVVLPATAYNGQVAVSWALKAESTGFDFDLGKVTKADDGDIVLVATLALSETELVEDVEVTLTVVTVPEEPIDISAVYSLPTTSEIYIEGVVTYVRANDAADKYTRLALINDGTASLMLYQYNADFVEEIIVGNKVKLHATLTIYNGMYEVGAAGIVDLEVVSTGNSLPEVVDITALVADANLNLKQSQIVKIVDAEFVSGTYDGADATTASLTFKVGDSNITFKIDRNWFGGDKAALSAVVSGLLAGQPCTLQGFVNWYNGFQLTPIADGCIVAANVESNSLSFNANGGTGEMNPTIVMTGNDLTVPSNGFTAPEGQQFKEWNTVADGSGTSYAPADIIAGFNADLQVYAIWETATEVTSSSIDFATNLATYTTGWSGYAEKTLSGSDLGTDACVTSVAFTRVSKQASTITDIPVLAANNSTIYVTFTVTGEEITSGSFVVKQWTTKKFTSIIAEYYDGTTWVKCGTLLENADGATTGEALAESTLNFTIPETVSGITQVRLSVTTTVSSNQQLGLKSATLNYK